MFEKNAEEWVKENMDCCKTDNSVNQPIPYFSEEERCCAKSAFQDGAEFGYNKANEWHYVKDEGTPTKQGHYLVCLRNKDHDIFDCWILFDKDIGWYSLQVRLVDIYAWKEIELPELKEIE